MIRSKSAFRKRMRPSSPELRQDVSLFVTMAKRTVKEVLADTNA
jgi:hypothetical protein